MLTVSDPLLVTSDNDDVIRSDEIRLVRKIAAGGMAEIRLYDIEKDDFPSQVAVKTLIQRDSLPKKKVNYLRTEANILTQIQHENVVRTYGTVSNRYGLGLVLDYYPCGSYVDFFFDSFWETARTLHGTGDLVEKLAPLKFRILAEIIRAMEYLHFPHSFMSSYKDKCILHLDLKGENVLLDNHLHAKICDFGLSLMSTLTSLISSSSMSSCAQTGGTLCFMAPERLRIPNYRPDKKCDVYSFGILQYTVITDSQPYEDYILRNIRLLEHHVAENHLRPELSIVPSCFPSHLKDKMESCWSADPEKRPSFEDLRIYMEKFISGIPNFNDRCNDAVEKALSVARSEDLGRRLSSSHCSSDDIGSDDPPGPCAPTEPKQPGGHSILQSWPPSYDWGFNQQPIGIRAPLISVGVGDDAKKSFFTRNKLISIAIAVSVLVVLTVGLTISKSNESTTIPALPAKAASCQLLKKPNFGTVTCGDETQTVKKCHFTCEKGYGMIGSDTTICIGGRWSNKEPSCELTCKPPTLANGFIDCTNENFNDSICSFSCENSHTLQGTPNATCLENGNWSVTLPSCVCPKCFVGDKCEYSISWQSVSNILDTISFYQGLEVNYGGKIFVCSSHVKGLDNSLNLEWGGTCTDRITGTQAVCNQGNHVSPSGKAIITCLQDGNWSEPIPACVCPECMIGENCAYSIRWKDVDNNLEVMQPYGVISVNYGGKIVVCSTELHSAIPVKWTGICVDKGTGTKHKCGDDHASPSGAADAAAAELIRDLVNRKTVRLPCDSRTMPTKW